MGRTWWITIALGIMAVACVAAGAFVIVRWSPHVPADAASRAVARTVMVGDIAPDEVAGSDPYDIPRSPYGQECLPRISNGAGYMDVCWEAYRDPFDADPEKDYYLLRVYSSFGRGAGDGLRWAILKADLVGEPQDGVLTSWPDGVFDASCEPMRVGLSLNLPDIEETLCGHINARDVAAWGHIVTWTCEGCLLPSDRDRSLSLYEEVGVAEGTVPSWEVFADLGG